MRLVQVNEGALETSYPSMEAMLSDKQREKWDAHLTNAQEYLDAGELIKSEFARLKDLNRFIEQAASHYIAAPFFHSGKYESLPEYIRYDLDYSNFALHTLPGKLKKAEAAQKKGDHPAIQAMIKLATELMPLHLMQKELKGMIVAKKAGQVAKAQEKETEEKFLASHKDVKKIKHILTEISKDLHDDVLAGNINNLNRIIENYWSQYDPSNHRATNNYAVNGRDPFKRQVVALSIARSETGTKSAVDPDQRAKPAEIRRGVEKYAQRMTDDLLEHFILKQTAKLSTIIVQKDNLTTVGLRNATTGSGVVEGTLELHFADESQFIVVSKVVWSMSKHGKVFYRFPTTFHNVIMPNGERMKGAASEARMNKEFAVQ